MLLKCDVVDRITCLVVIVVVATCNVTGLIDNVSLSYYWCNCVRIGGRSGTFKHSLVVGMSRYGYNVKCIEVVDIVTSGADLNKINNLYVGSGE